MGCSNSRQLSVDSGTKKEEASVEARISGKYFVSNVRYIPIYVLCSNTLIILYFYFCLLYLSKHNIICLYLGQREVQKLSSSMRFEELPPSLLAEIASYTRSRNKKGVGSDVLLAVALSGSTNMAIDKRSWAPILGCTRCSVDL